MDTPPQDPAPVIFLLLTFALGLLPGVVAFALGRGPSASPALPFPPVAALHAEPPESARSRLSERASLPAIATLRDGAVGHTRWAFAALVCRLARDGHCTLVRTHQRRWFRPAPVVTVDLHADLTALAPLEQTVLRQLGRHDTLDGFGFAGSTFRRRTLRDVRATLVEKGWLADRRRCSNACLLAGGALVGASGTGLLVGGASIPVAAAAGLGSGGLLAALRRYPVTDEGARRRAAHRAYADRRRKRIRELLPARPERAADELVDALPALVLERIATPAWLDALSDRFAAAAPERPSPGWLRDEADGLDTFADACRTLAAVLAALGAGSWTTGR